MEKGKTDFVNWWCLTNQEDIEDLEDLSEDILEELRVESLVNKIQK